MARQRLLAATILLGACLSGVAGGIGAAALGLALFSKAITTLSVEQAETLLVAGPLAGLLPASFLLLAARRDRQLARLLPPAFAIWVACGAISFAWLALSQHQRWLR